MSTRTYLTSSRFEALKSTLSDLDCQIIADLYRLTTLSGDQLARLHFDRSPSAKRLARYHLNRLTRIQVLTRLGRRIGGARAGSAGYIYRLGVAGQRLVNPDSSRHWQPKTPGESFLTHCLAVSELYVALRLAERGGKFKLVTYCGEPDCWQSYHGPGGAHLVLKPDALVVIKSAGFEDHFFVEVDQASESTSRIAIKLKAYLAYYNSGRYQDAHGVFPLVLFVVPDSRRRRQIREVINRLSPDEGQLFGVTESHRAVETMSDCETGGAA